MKPVTHMPQSVIGSTLYFCRTGHFSPGLLSSQHLKTNDLLLSSQRQSLFLTSTEYLLWKLKAKTRCGSASFLKKLRSPH